MSCAASFFIARYWYLLLFCPCSPYTLLQKHKGGIWLVEIIFQGRDDAEKCYLHLLNKIKAPKNNETILLIEEQNIVRIVQCFPEDPSFNQMKKAFCEFVLIGKRDDWFRKILKEKYFFKDPEDQVHILEIIYSILEGEREDLAVFLKKSNEEPRIVDAVDQLFQANQTILFEPFIRFRLRQYLLELESYVKISIDEFKMEQEYQMFIQILREFLHGREPKMEILHLLLDENITFYNESFEEMKRRELAKMVDRKLLFNHPVYVDSVSIAPLLSIAPNTIFLYAKDQDAALVRTIRNIFEERVTLLPFHTYLEKIHGINSGRKESWE